MLVQVHHCKLLSFSLLSYGMWHRVGWQKCRGISEVPVAFNGRGEVISQQFVMIGCVVVATGFVQLILQYLTAGPKQTASHRPELQRSALKDSLVCVCVIEREREREREREIDNLEWLPNSAGRYVPLAGCQQAHRSVRPDVRLALLYCSVQSFQWASARSWCLMQVVRSLRLLHSTRNIRTTTSYTDGYHSWILL